MSPWAKKKKTFKVLSFQLEVTFILCHPVSVLLIVLLSGQKKKREEKVSNQLLVKSA